MCAGTLLRWAAWIACALRAAGALVCAVRAVWGSGREPGPGYRDRIVLPLLIATALGTVAAVVGAVS